MNKKQIIQKIQHIKRRLTKRPFDSANILYLLTGFLAIISCCLIFWFTYQQFVGRVTPGSLIDPNGGKNNEEPEDTRCEYMRVLDGVCVEKESDTTGESIAIMVENHFEANPLSGISDAAVVYEAPVEGHIPRLLAIYSAKADVSQVGPVRSARPYYLDWVSEYGDAMYMHVGGSPEALEKIWAFDMFDMNEFSRGWYYWRSNTRRAPHNTYTSSNLWSQALEKYGEEDMQMLQKGWRFGDMEPCVEDCVSRIDIEQSVGGYDLAWEYDTLSEQYERTQFGKVHRDMGGSGYVADTILIQRVEATVVDGVGRLHIETIGEGDGYVFRNGYAIAATWKKDERTSRTRWFDEEEKEIALKPGKIWVQVVSQNGTVEVVVE
jgi:hypothetical protein